MTDHVDSAKRSTMMAAVHAKDTEPEMVVRKIVHSMGYRYRLHVKELPGKPDLVFSRRRKIIFVHGCFWHRHEACTRASMPKTRVSFWQSKFDANIARDEIVLRSLKKDGWRVMTVWQCELKSVERLTKRLKRFLVD